MKDKVNDRAELLKECRIAYIAYISIYNRKLLCVCLFVTFLFIPALLPSPVQSRYDWMKHSIWQKNKLQDTKQIQKNIN